MELSIGWQLLKLFWKPVLIILVLFSGYEYIGHSFTVAQRAKDAKVINSLKETITKQDGQIKKDTEAFNKIHSKLEVQAAQFKQEQHKSQAELDVAKAEKQLALKDRAALDKKYQHELADAKLAKLLSPDCELPHDSY